MNFLKIAGRDLKKIFKNRLIRVSIIAIIIVPLLYSLLYLDAFWDPYSKLENLPIAVVNLDKGATLDGKNVNYGQDVVDKLNENSTVGWRFVSEQDADEGVDGDKYYAKFQIDSDFSQKVINAKSGKPTQAGLKFVCNEKKNFLAAQVNSKVESALKEQIVSTITNNYVKVSFDNLYEVKDGMQTAADGSTKINDGVSELNGKVPELVDGTTKLKDGSLQLFNGQTDLNTGLGTLSNGIGTLNDGLGKLQGGTTSIYNGLYSMQSGLAQINGGLGTLNSKVPTLVNGVSSLYAGSDKLAAGTTAAKDGSQKLSDGSSQLYSSYETTIYPSILKLKEGSDQLKAGLDNGKADITKLGEAAPKLSTASDQIAGASDSINSNYATIKSGVDSLIQGSGASSEVMAAVGTDLTAAMNSTDDATKNANIMKALQKLQVYKAANVGSDQKIAALSKGANDLQTGISTYNTSVKGYTTGVKTFTDGTTKLASSTSNLSSGVTQINGGLTSIESGLKNQFGPGLKSVSNGSSSLNDGLFSLQTGASQINTGLSTLNSSTPELASGVTTLYNGSSSALSGSNALYSGSGELLAGVNSASSGTNSLYAGSKDALSGSSKLVTGQGELKDGIVTLNSKVPALQDGVGKLYDGTQELSTKLGDGATKLSDGLVNSSEDMASFVSNPIELKIAPVNPVPNYGTGFAPYFMNLSLWIGAIMMFFVIPTKVDEDIKTSEMSKVIGKFLSFGFIGILQAVLVGIVVMLLGLRPTNIASYFGLLIFFSLVYVSIVQCLITLFGDPGRLLSIVLLILQLTSCAGTFPLELIPNFFKVMFPFMPFTYSVEALREACSAVTMNHGMIVKDVVVLTIVMGIFLVISIVFKKQGEKLQEIMEGRKNEIHGTN